MLEIPEAVCLSSQLAEVLTGKTIQNVVAEFSPHKFAWYAGNPKNYHALLSGKRITGAASVAGMVEIKAQDCRIVFTDGIAVRYYNPGSAVPRKHQLLAEFEDFSFICCSVQMYGGLWAFREGELDNPYYLGAKAKPSPLCADFTYTYFKLLYEKCPGTLSAKAFLATEQRIPGLGNGVLQDILFNAGVHPRRKLSTLSESGLEKLSQCVKDTLFEMTAQGGRDTENDLFGSPGGYKTILSKLTASGPCPVCSGKIVKEAYLGGSVYFCPECQRL